MHREIIWNFIAEGMEWTDLVERMDLIKIKSLKKWLFYRTQVAELTHWSTLYPSSPSCIEITPWKSERSLLTLISYRNYRVCPQEDRVLVEPSVSLSFVYTLYTFIWSKLQFPQSFLTPQYDTEAMLGSKYPLSCLCSIVLKFKWCTIVYMALNWTPIYVF